MRYHISYVIVFPFIDDICNNVFIFIFFVSPNVLERIFIIFFYPTRNGIYKRCWSGKTSGEKQQSIIIYLYRNGETSVVMALRNYDLKTVLLDSKLDSDKIVCRLLTLIRLLLVSVRSLYDKLHIIIIQYLCYFIGITIVS